LKSGGQDGAFGTKQSFLAQKKKKKKKKKIEEVGVSLLFFVLFLTIRTRDSRFVNFRQSGLDRPDEVRKFF
jgi:hypothetical protein